MPCTWKVITVEIPSLPFLGQVVVLAWVVGVISVINEWGRKLRRAEHESNGLESLGEVLRHLEAFSLYTGFIVVPFLVIGLFRTC